MTLNLSRPETRKRGDAPFGKMTLPKKFTPIGGVNDRYTQPILRP